MLSGYNVNCQTALRITELQGALKISSASFFSELNASKPALSIGLNARISL